MRLGGLLVEAKLTEKDFTKRPKEHVFRYSHLKDVFDIDTLPSDGTSFFGYQLIRNVLAAVQDQAQFIVLLDQRRPDLLQEWWNVAGAIRDKTVRRRCGFRTWQQIAAVAPRDLREFLELKYGL